MPQNLTNAPAQLPDALSRTRRTAKQLHRASLGFKMGGRKRGLLTAISNCLDPAKSLRGWAMRSRSVGARDSLRLAIVQLIDVIDCLERVQEQLAGYPSRTTSPDKRRGELALLHNRIEDSLKAVNVCIDKFLILTVDLR